MNHVHRICRSLASLTRRAGVLVARHAAVPAAAAATRAELSGLVASAPAEWRTLKKIALAGTRTGGSPPRRARRGGMRGRRSYRGTARCPGSGWRASC